jgi:acetylornithine deacetylase/succinyl-diaminopimelate desuccinylase-like protein
LTVLAHGSKFTPSLEQRSKEWNMTVFEDVVALTELLVATPSPNLPGDERAVAAVVTDAANHWGLTNVRTLAEVPERPNVIVDIDFGSGGRHLALSGHLDTKPVGDAVWATDPFVATRIDGYLYGLGTCDMKGAVAAMIIAAGRVAATGLDAGRLTLVLTADEEYGSRFGSRYLAENSLVSADAIVIGEPGGVHRDWDQVSIVSRGIANVHIEVLGDQGHSSLSTVRGNVFATQQMAWLLNRFAADFAPSHPENRLGATPTVNAGVMVEGGVGFGVVPGRASFSSDIRLLPGMTRDQFERDLTAFLEASSAVNPDLRASYRFETPPRDWLPPTEVPADHAIVRSCQRALMSIQGEQAPVGVFPGTTDACWLQGLLGIPTLPAFGPGMLDRAHAADERILISALEEAVPIYESLIRDFCGGDE